MMFHRYFPGPMRYVYQNSFLYRLRHKYASYRVLRVALAHHPIRLHLGSGKRVLPGWINIDARSYPGVAVMHLPSGLKWFPNDSASFVYCSHMLEHLDYPEQVHKFTTEIHRILKPGGVLRIVVPGIERIIRAYVADDKQFFKEQQQHHPSNCTTKLEHLMYALQQDGEHKYGYDFETARKFLQLAGFISIKNSSYNESEFTELRVDYRGKDLSLFVDAVK
jgi:predicted SAM-dependent methyltransferase